VFGSWTDHARPHTRPCFAAYRLRTRPCSGHGRTMCMARVRPCTQFVPRPRAAVYSLCTAAHGRVQTVYTAMHGPCAWSVRDRVHGCVCGCVDGRVYGPCARRCTYRVYGRVHGRSRRERTVYTGVQGSCTWCVHDRIQSTPTRSCTLYTAVFTARVHGRPRSCTDCVHGRARATYMVRP